MTNLSAKQIAHLAKLTRLGLSEADAARAADDVSKILNHFATIKDIDTRRVPTYDNATGLTNVSRADTAVPDHLCFAPALLAAAPAVVAQHVKVQAIFGEETQPSNVP